MQSAMSILNDDVAAAAGHFLPCADHKNRNFWSSRPIISPSVQVWRIERLQMQSDVLALCEPLAGHFERFKVRIVLCDHVL